MRRLRTLSQLWLPFTKSRASLYASSSSFYILLSVFPAALFLLTLLPYLPISLESWMEVLREIVPQPFYPVVEYVFDTVKTNTTLTLLSVSALTTLWSASKGVLSIADGLEAMLRRQREHRYLRRRLMSIAYFLILALALSATLAIHVFGEALLAACVRWFPGLIRGAALVYRLRSPYLLVLFGLLFALIYWLFSKRELRFRWCFLGGLGASACWVLVSWAFSIYVNFFAGYVKLYGGIGLLILTCIWLHICLLLFLYGALAADLLHHRSYRPLQILKETFSRR